MTDALKALFLLGVSATLMGLFLMLVRRVFGKRLPGVFYYLAWLVVLLRFVVPLPGLIPVGGAAGSAPAAAPAQTARPYGSTWSTGASRDDYDGYLRTYNRTSELADEEDAGDAPAATGAEGAGKTAFSWSAAKRALTSPRLWCAVWLIGAAVSAARYIVGYYRFVRAIRRTEREPTDKDLALYFAMPGKNKPGLVRSRCVSSPMLMGVFRPTLVLPCREYTPDMLANIFRHELTHYRRGDIAYKWLAAFVFSVYWFDPAVPLFRRELERVCELSCDERVIRTMSEDEKRSYGETLLSLASRAGSRTSALATSFATQKRDLKERLEQIMTFKTKGRASLALALAAVLLLAGCGAALAPSAGRGTGSADTAPSAPAGETPAPGALRLVTAASVDELLGAIGSNTVITVLAGRYDLTSAADYGAAGAGAGYTWSDAFDGYELDISGVSNLTIKADGDVEITTLPRYANVVRLSSCTGVTLSGLTLGHEEAPGYCAGNVVRVDSCTDVAVNSCGLYGCGVVGVFATNSQRVFVNDSDIYECTQNAVIAHSCRDVRVTGCRVYDCGGADSASYIFRAESTTAFAVVNCDVTGNSARSLMGLTYSTDCALLGTAVRDNSFSEALLDLRTANDLAVCLTVGGCEFDVPAAVPVYAEGGSAAVDASGAELTDEALRTMALERTVYAGPEVKEPPALNSRVNADGMTEVRAATVDEFLAAIAPNTVIYLDAETFDLSTAASYGGYGSNYYYWLSDFDGPGLVITGVENLSIISENNATVAAIPRYVDVLGFRKCSGITLSGFTAGHTEKPGSCYGGVLYFDACSDISIADCRLYGCGTVGIQANTSQGLDVRDTEIYDCSSCAVNLIDCTGAVFTNCNIHDCGTPELYFDGSSSVIYDGAELAPSVYAIGADGAPTSFDSSADKLIIYYQADTSGEIGSECTLHVGDSVTFYARYADGTRPDNVLWLCSPENSLALTFSGDKCEVTADHAAEDGVKLIALDADKFQGRTPTADVTVYVVL